MNKLKIAIRNFLWKILGSENVSLEVKQLRGEMNALFYFLNNFIDIRTLPPAKDPDLRIMQLCDVQLLAILDKVCKKNDLVYWLEFGTLLGAYRHHGFIPWDDDTDISMPRDSYNRAETILKDQLSQYGISVMETDGRIGVGFQHEKTGIWVDIFPIDVFFSDLSLTDVQTFLLQKINKYFCDVGLSVHMNHTKFIRSLKDGSEFASYGKNHYLYYCPRWPNDDFFVQNYMDVFPLKEISFESVLFPVPCKVEVYLKHIYNDYMQFPRSDVSQHGKDGIPLSARAKIHNVDMNDILSQLQYIYKML